MWNCFEALILNDFSLIYYRLDYTSFVRYFEKKHLPIE